MKRRSNLRKIFFLILFFGFLVNTLLAGPDYKDISLNGVIIRESPALNYCSKFGYQTRRLIINNTNNKEHEVKIIGEVAGGEVTKTIKVNPLEKRIEYFYVSVNKRDYRSTTLEVYIDGTKISKTLNNESISRDQLNFFIDPTLPDFVFGLVHAKSESDTKEEGADNSRVRRRYNSDKGLFEEVVDPYFGGIDQLPDIWQAYLQYNAIIFSSKTLKKLSFNVRNALFDYVRIGGFLIILNESEYLPNDAFFLEENKKAAVYELGTGHLMIVKDISISSDSELNLRDKTLLIDDESKPVVSEIEVVRANVYTEPIIKKYLITRNSTSAVVKFKKEETLDYDVNVVYFIAILTALIIGPVNFLFLFLKRKQILIFATIPIISFVICSCIFIYYYFFESLTLNIRKYALINLSEPAGKASIYMNYGIFSAKERNGSDKKTLFANNNCLEFANSAAVLPVFESEYSSNIKFGNITLGDSQKFTSNWIHGKNIEEFRVFDVENARERIDISGSAVKKAFNGLGADINRLFYRDFDGKIYTAGLIKNGDTVELTLADKEKFSMSVNQKIYEYDYLWSDLFENEISLKPGKYLRKGQYYVELASMPYLKQKLETEANLKETVYLIGTKGKALL